MDGVSNGYRNFLLPLASQNILVRQALLASSANYIRQKRSGLEKEAVTFQAAAIHSLRQCSNPYGTESDSTATLAAILLLLVNDMANGGSDFEILHKMAKSWITATQYEIPPRERLVMEFLKEQIKT